MQWERKYGMVYLRNSLLRKWRRNTPQFSAACYLAGERRITMVELSGVTTQLVSLALDASVLRHQAIANNIANGNNPGYAPIKVSFEDQLSSAIEAVKDRRDDA